MHRLVGRLTAADGMDGAECLGSCVAQMRLDGTF